MELGSDFQLIKALDSGLIPSIYFSDAPFEDLEAYAGNYLKEEIAAEAIVRNVPAFSRFLTVAGLCNGRMINYADIASDAQVPRSTVQEYFQILRDTLLGDDLPAWRDSVRRKPIFTSKFYFFDIGVARYLQGRRGLEMRSPEFGKAFEAYRRPKTRESQVGGLSHRRSHSAGRHPQAGRRNARHTQRDPPGHPHQGDEHEGEMVRDED